jgi:hypothetical protein
MNPRTFSLLAPVVSALESCGDSSIRTNGEPPHKVKRRRQFSTVHGPMKKLNLFPQTLNDNE